MEGGLTSRINIGREKQKNEVGKEGDDKVGGDEMT